MLLPVESSSEIIIGTESIELAVYAAADPPLRDNEITWSKPNGDIILTSKGRFSVLNRNKQLVILNPGIGENGMFLVSISRVNGSGVQKTVSANISLNIYGKYSVFNLPELSMQDLISIIFNE